MPAPGTTRLHAALRGNASTCIGTDGQLGLLLPLRDVGGALYANLVAVWMGGEGLGFMHTHAADLVAGRCVDIEVYRVRPDGDELRARIAACHVLPKSPSQLKHEEKHEQKHEEKLNHTPEKATP